MARAKEKLKEVVEEVKETVAVAEAHYEEAEAKTDGILQKVVDSKVTALIVGGAVGFLVAFYLVTC